MQREADGCEMFDLVCACWTKSAKGVEYGEAQKINLHLEDATGRSDQTNRLTHLASSSGHKIVQYKAAALCILWSYTKT